MNLQPTIPLGQYRLRSYVYFGLVDEGVWFEAGRNSFLLPDRNLYPLAERFVALLDSRLPIEVILDRAPGPVSEFFARLFQSLRDHQMLTKLPQDGELVQTSDLPSAARSIFEMLQDQLEGDVLAQAWRRWREARLLLIGCGHSLRTAALNFTESGAGAVDCLALENGRSEDAEWLAQASGQIQQRDEATPDEIAAYDLVVFATDDLDRAELRVWAERLNVAGSCAVMAAGIGRLGLIVPQERGGRLRLESSMSQLSEPTDLPDLGCAGLSILGAVAGHAALERFFGLSEDHADHALVVDGTLEITRHPAVPLPRLDTGRTVPFVTVPRHELPEARPLELFEQVSLALDPWYDPLFGPLRKQAQPGLLQIPLMQQQLDVRIAESTKRVNGWGLDLGAAGLRVIEAALVELAIPLCPDDAAVSASVDGSDWRPMAMARLLDRGGRLDHREPADADLADSAEPEIRLLARLLRFHAGEHFAVELARDREGLAWAATVRSKDEDLARGLGSCRDQAIIEALGLACSRLQWKSSGLDFAVVTPREVGLPPLEAETTSSVIFQSIDQLELPSGITCGFARFSREQPSC